MKEKNTVPIYFFYGTQTEEIMRASDNAVREILGETSRDENLTIYTPPGNQKTVEFANILSELNADLATMSLVAENEKVAIVYNPAEVFSESGARARRPAKPKKGRTAKAESPNAGASDEPAIPPYLTWIEKRLPETGNHLIILAFEDEADGREVPKEHPILQIAGRMGLTAAFREKDKLIFKIEDSIRGRDALGCIAQIRELWKPGRSDMNIYTGVVRCIRFMLQAGIVRDRRIGHDPEKIALFFPANPKMNILKAHSFVQSKYISYAASYRTADLLKAYERLLDVARALRPAPGTEYVADAALLLEEILMELFASPRPNR